MNVNKFSSKDGKLPLRSFCLFPDLFDRLTQKNTDILSKTKNICKIQWKYEVCVRNQTNSKARSLY